MCRATFVFALGFICLVATVSAGPPAFPKYCSGVSTSCSAKASSNTFIRGPGHCKVVAAAKCLSLADATFPCLDAKFRYFRIDKCYPTKASIEAIAYCFAKAVAEVFTKAVAAVDCDGKKAYGCAWSKAQGKAFACSYALALVKLVVKIGGHDVDCETTVGALAEVFAEAAAKSAADTCAHNGKAFDFDEDFASAIHEQIATALAGCWAYCDGTEAEVVAIGEGEVEDARKESIFGDNADASTGRDALKDFFPSDFHG